VLASIASSLEMGNPATKLPTMGITAKRSEIDALGFSSHENR